MEFIKKYRLAILLSILIVATTGGVEYFFGRSPLGPDGTFQWWDGNVLSNENSQRVADAYSFSHVIHGLGFYWFLWLVARKVPVKYRFVIALLMEAVWELFENSSFIINRYREGTIAQDYVGDSILNSLSDILMVAIGFLLAWFSKIWISIFLVILMELGCLLWIRDNLTLNIVMLVYPSETILEWQSEK